MATYDLSTARWRTSSRSIPNGSCVELATDGDTWVAIRDSKHRHGPALVFGTHAVLALVSGQALERPQ